MANYPNARPSSGRPRPLPTSPPPPPPLPFSYPVTSAAVPAPQYQPLYAPPLPAPPSPHLPASPAPPPLAAVFPHTSAAVPVPRYENQQMPAGAVVYPASAGQQVVASPYQLMQQQHAQQQHVYHHHAYHAYQAQQKQNDGGCMKPPYHHPYPGAAPITPEQNLRPSPPVTPIPIHIPQYHAPPGYPGTPTLDQSAADLQEFPTMTTMAGNSTSAVVVVNALDARRIEFVEDAMKVWHEERRFPFRKPWVKFSKDENGNGVFKEVHFSKENFLEYYSTLKSTHFLSLQQVERLLYGENEDYTTYIVKIKCENAGDFVILEEHFPTWDKMLDNRYAIAKLNYIFPCDLATLELNKCSCIK